MNTRKSQPGKSKKAASRKKPRVYELTRKELFLWFGVGFLALVWMFTLGVIVGRGVSPVRFDVEKLKKELIALKEQTLKNSGGTTKSSSNTLSEGGRLGFYDELTDKKEEARLKTLAKPHKRPIRSKPSVTHKQTARSAPSTQDKTLPANKAKQAFNPSLTKEPSPGGSFTLQVASLRDFSKARKMVSLLKKKGFNAYAVSARINGKGTYHRVRIGHFKKRDDATATALRLRAEKFEPLVLKE